MKLIKYIIILIILLPITIFSQGYPLKGKTIKSLEVKIEYDKGSEMNVDTKFAIKATVKMENGKTKVDYIYPDAYQSSYIVELKGAKYDPWTARMVPYKYCEEYTNKELILTVSAVGINTITKTFTFTMNCIQSPAAIAQQKKDKEEELQKIAKQNALEKLAKQKLEAEINKIEKLKSEGKVIGLTLPYSTISTLTFDMVKFKHLKTVKIDNEFLFLGGDWTTGGNYEMLPAIYKLKNNKLEPLALDLVDFPLLKRTAIRDMIKISETEVVVSTDNGFIKMEKTSTGYKNTLHLNAKDGDPLSFPHIVSLGNGKCASIGYPREIPSGTVNYVIRHELSIEDYTYNDAYKEMRDNHESIEKYNNPDTRRDTTAYLLIWDYNTNDFAYMLLDANISEESILVSDNAGNLIFSEGRNSKPFHPSFSNKTIFYKSTENIICSINVAKSLENKKLEYNWWKFIDTGNSSDPIISFVISDLIIEDNNDIVLVGISPGDAVYDVDDNGNKFYNSNIGIGRLSPQGNVKNWNFDTGLNVSLWGGSNNGNLILKNNPGKIYYSYSQFPKLIASPDGNGYIITTTVGPDELTYPTAYHEAKDTKSEINMLTPLFILINKEDLKPVSFDLISNGSYSGSDHFLFYNSNSKKYSYFKTRHSLGLPSFLLEFELNFDDSWSRQPNVQESKSGDNGYYAYIDENYGDHESAPDDFKNESTSSSSTVSTSKYVTVYNKTGKDIYYVEESSSNPTRINANSSDKLECSEDYWYTFDANDGINGGNSSHPKLYNANSSCGSSVTIK